MKKSTDNVKTLFPQETIQFGEEETDSVVMSPLPMSELPGAIDAFAGIFEELYQEGSEEFSASSMAMAGKKLFSDILNLLPKCADRPLSDIPASATPKMIHVFIRQNVLDVWGNWQALASDLGLAGLYQKATLQKPSPKKGGSQS